MKSFDAIIVGAGHNGVAAATILAKTGRRVAVVEASDAVGGMARTIEFAPEKAPGFRVSPVAHIINKLDKNVIRTLELEKHGLDLESSSAQTVCISADGNHVVLDADYGAKIDGLSSGEQSAWKELRDLLMFQSAIVRQLDSRTPVQFAETGVGEKISLLKSAFNLRFSGKSKLRDFLRMALMCVADVADEHLSDDSLKGLLSFDATLGIHLGPRSPTSLLGLYHRLGGGTAGPQIIPKGGLGSVMEVFHRSAEAAGVSFVLNAKVAEIAVENSAVKGIRTVGGDTFHSTCVISAINPVATFMELVGPQNLDTGFVRDISTIRHKGNVSRLNLALSSTIEIDGLDKLPHSTRFVCASSINQVESSFNPSKYGELCDQPTFEFIVPSTGDNTMAPEGASTLSIAIQNTPYDLKEGWKSGKVRLEKTVMARLEKLVPGIGRQVLAVQLLSPVDIEHQFNAPGGHWHHGELQIDRLYALRPVFGAANYRAPVEGLYLSGAGTHPGGGISGIPGLNVAREVISDRAGA